MMLKLFNYELYFRLESHTWAGANRPYSHTWSVELLHLSTEEKEHRADWQLQNPGKKYPTY